MGPGIRQHPRRPEGVLRVCLVGLSAGGHSGVPRYAAALTGALDRVAGDFPELALRLLTTARGAEQCGARQLEVEVARAPSAGPGRILNEQARARRAEGDPLHFFD